MNALYGNFQVEDAQGHEAPIQRLADSIAGPFVYSVMTLSAATFAFWYIFLLNLFQQFCKFILVKNRELK